MYCYCCFFQKINNEFDRFIKYINSDGLILRFADNANEFIRKLYDSLLVE